MSRICAYFMICFPQCISKNKLWTIFISQLHRCSQIFEYIELECLITPLFHFKRRFHFLKRTRGSFKVVFLNQHLFSKIFHKTNQYLYCLFDLDPLRDDIFFHPIAFSIFLRLPAFLVKLSYEQFFNFSAFILSEILYYMRSSIIPTFCDFLLLFTLIWLSLTFKLCSNEASDINRSMVL